MARERPTASNDSPLLTGVDAVRTIGLISDGPILTRAEARALKRSTPLKREQFKTSGSVAVQGISPLRTPPGHADDVPRTGAPRGA